MIKKITMGVIVVSVSLLIVYDIGAIAIGGVDASISHILWEEAKVYPVIPLAFGFLMGHLFFAGKDVGT